MFNFGEKKKRIFLDYAATTPVSDSVFAAMKPFFTDIFFNPSSVHAEGVKAKEALEGARKEVAKILSVKSSEVYFTGGGTESANLAMLGIGRHFLGNKNFSGKPHVIVSKTEHPAVLEGARQLEREGAAITFLDVDEEGLISPEAVIDAMTEQTVLVAVMYVNSEIGVVSPIGKISRSVKKYKKQQGRDVDQYPYVYTDASQAPNYLSVQVEKIGADLMTLDGSKIYGPKSSGILFKKNYVPIKHIFFGGNQENGLRAGTENVAAIVGFAKALSETQAMREKESLRLKELQDYFIDAVLEKFPEASLNGSGEQRLPNNVNICFPGQHAEFLVLKLDTRGVAVSATTACKSLDDTAHSYVVEALGKEDENQRCAESSIRFSFGRGTTKGELGATLEILKNVL